MADIVLNITIPEEHQQRVIDAFTLASGKGLQLSVCHDVVDGRWNFVIDPKQPDETMKEFGERFLKGLGIAVIRLVDLCEDTQRYRTEIADIDQPSQDVPDDVLE